MSAVGFAPLKRGRGVPIGGNGVAGGFRRPTLLIDLQSIRQAIACERRTRETFSD
jgi:hypothetical protein